MKPTTWSEEILYQDTQVICYYDRLEIKNYYFPFATSKIISYEQITGWWEKKLYVLTEKAWGMTSLPYWFNLDLKRSEKKDFVAIETGDWITPVITADDHAQFTGVLKKKLKHRETRVKYVTVQN